MKKIHYIMLLLFVGLMVLPNIEIIAQCIPPQLPCCPTPGACGPTCPDCTPVPLDGGLSALLFAGVAYGAKRIYGKSKS
jgi:hypothetical protein